MGLADSQYFLPLTRALTTLRASVPTAALLHQAQVPRTMGYRILRFYETHNALRLAGGIESDARRIVTLQGGLRAERAIPDKLVQAGPPLPHTERILDALDIPYAFGLQTAANLHAYFEPSSVHVIYIQRAATPAQTSATTRRVAEALRGHKQASAADRYEFLVDDLERLDVQETHAGNMTSPVQTLLDLSLHNRTAPHREFMFETLRRQGALHG